MNKFIVVDADNEASDLFESLDEAKSFISDEYDETEAADAVVYQVSKTYTVKSAGIELQED